MSTEIDLRTIDPRFQPGLVFSFYEGLIQGNEFKLIFDQDPQYIKKQFSEAHLSEAQLHIEQIDPSTWHVHIAKLSSKKISHDMNGCCGICGDRQE